MKIDAFFCFWRLEKPHKAGKPTNKHWCSPSHYINVCSRRYLHTTDSPDTPQLTLTAICRSHIDCEMLATQLYGQFKTNSHVCFKLTARDGLANLWQSGGCRPHQPNSWILTQTHWYYCHTITIGNAIINNLFHKINKNFVRCDISPQ